MTKQWIDRVKASMKRQKITQIELAETRIGLSQPWLSMKLREKTKATIDDVTMIANALGESVPYILTGQRPISEIETDVPLVPRINWEDVKGWPENRNEIDVIDWIYPHNPREISSDAFSVTQIGDSMISPNGLQSIPDGAFLIVDPQTEPTTGCFVIAIIGGTPSLKKLASDGVTTLFKSMNPDYPPIPKSKDVRIVGVLNEAILYFRLKT